MREATLSSVSCVLCALCLVAAGGARYNAQGSDVTTLFVKGLPSGAPEALLRAALLAAFETCGPIVQVREPCLALYVLFFVVYVCVLCVCLGVLSWCACATTADRISQPMLAR